MKINLQTFSVLLTYTYIYIFIAVVLDETIILVADLSSRCKTFTSHMI